MLSPRDISGVSPVGIAENGTLIGKAFSLVICLVFTNLPSYLPWLASGLFPMVNATMEVLTPEHTY